MEIKPFHHWALGSYSWRFPSACGAKEHLVSWLAGSDHVEVRVRDTPGGHFMDGPRGQHIRVSGDLAGVDYWVKQYATHLHAQRTQSARILIDGRPFTARVHQLLGVFGVVSLIPKSTGQVMKYLVYRRGLVQGSTGPQVRWHYIGEFESPKDCFPRAFSLEPSGDFANEKIAALMNAAGAALRGKVPDSLKESAE
ncbi:hypothetical protein ABZV14_05875 [Streptosporangium canum]|uniref:hypothetical protein n=1 Tax=Streptosporangium canum TaxID=324952 RepID=UPI0033BE5E21